MTFHAKASTLGNSKGLRLDAALYREHPEFATGEFEVNVIAPGRLLIRAGSQTAVEETLDPVIDAFLAFLEQSMTDNPEALTPMRFSEARVVRELIKGIEVSDDEVFDDSFVLP